MSESDQNPAAPPAPPRHFRRLPRPGRRVLLRYTVDGGAPLSAYTVNIGIGGAFIESGAPPPPGTRLDVQLEVPPVGPMITVHADVRWIGTSDDGGVRGMGVQFRELGEAEHQMLEDWFGSFTDTLDFDEAP
jgi:hypothetical protein